MVSIENDTQIGRKWAAQINRVKPRQCVASHRKHFLDGRTAPANPQTLSEIKDANHTKALKEQILAEAKHRDLAQEKIAEEEDHTKRLYNRINELYDYALRGIKKAIDKDDLRNLAACLAQGIAVVKLQYESEGLAKLQERVDDLTELMANNE